MPVNKSCMVKALTLAAKDFQQTSSAKQNNPVDLVAYDLILILILTNNCSTFVNTG